MSGFRMHRDLPSFDSVAAGETASCDVPVGWTYHTFFLEYGGATLAQLNEIRLIIDGRVTQRFKGASARLDVINQYCGLAAANGVIRLDMDRVKLLTRDAREYTALGTALDQVQGAPVKDKKGRVYPQPQQVTIEVDIDGAAVSPTLKASAIRSAADPVGELLELQEFGYNPSASGDFDIDNLPLPNSPRINKLYIFDPGSIINRVKLQRDDRTAFNRKPATNDLVQSDGIRVPQANLFVIDPSETGYGGNPIETVGVQDFRVTVNVSGAGSLPVVVEYMKQYRP